MAHVFCGAFPLELLTLTLPVSASQVCSEVPRGLRLECPSVCPEQLYMQLYQSWRTDPQSRPVISYVCGVRERLSVLNSLPCPLPL
jgi:hypothetical protein